MILLSVSDSDIREDILTAIDDLTEDGLIEIPADGLNTFIEDCAASVTDFFDLYDAHTLPDFRLLVSDMADLYKYSL